MEVWRQELYSKELYHHGIPGMKWGTKNGPPYPLKPSARSSAERKEGSPIAKKFADRAGAAKEKKRAKKALKQENKRIKRERKVASKNIRTLSDKDIEQRIKRLENEKKLRQLTNEDLHPGRTAVGKLLSGSGSSVAKTVATGAMLYGVKAGTLKKGGAFKGVDWVDLAGYVAPKPKKK